MKRLIVMMLGLGIAVGLQAVPKKNEKRAVELDVPRDQVIAAALYTVHNNTLKLNAQLFPLKSGEDRDVRLEIKGSKGWKEIARVKICENEYGNKSGDQSWTALFRVENWDDTKNVPYRVAHGENAFFEGTVRKNPVDKEEIVVAGFTGNSVMAGHGGDISRQDLVDNVKRVDADLLFFSGDQVYNHTKHYEYWLKFCLDFADIMKDRPTVSIPDDHDVGQPNLWGQSGKKSTKGGATDGGYAMPAQYVIEVERAQTANLPDPYDPAPIGQGIGVYYTDLNWGRISFGILEDRKFKTGPRAVRDPQKGRADHVPSADFDLALLEREDLKMLGDRQLEFLDAWGQDWEGADFKVALSQTIFCGGAHIHGKVGGRVFGDLDSNGWPRAARDKAVKALRKAYAFHYAGDQHLATVFHHGVEEHGDSIYSFCVPSIANLYMRWWKPEKAGANRLPGQNPMFGDHFDTFGNKVTMLAVANPAEHPNGGDKLTTRAAGFGIVRFNKKTRKITMECWPRNVDVTKDKPYPGWPITIDQTDNYGRKAVAHLPTIKVKGSKNPVVKVIDEATGEWIYALRINGDSFQPKVFKKGTYTVEVDGKPFQGLEAKMLNDPAVLEVELEGLSLKTASKPASKPAPDKKVESETRKVKLVRAVSENVQPLRERLPSRPNIITVMVDDLGWNQISVPQSTMGTQRAEYSTPTLEMLANKGLSFTHAYAQPNCAPTRAAMLSGQYPARIHNDVYVVGNLNRFGKGGASGISKSQARFLGPAQTEDVAEEAITVAEALKKNGYSTAHIGKYHVGGHEGDATLPHNAGFDINVGGCSQGHQTVCFSSKDKNTGGWVFKKLGLGHFDKYAAPYTKKYVVRHNFPASLVGTPKHVSDAVGDAMEETISVFTSIGKPFYLQLHPYAVHGPVKARPDLKAAAGGDNFAGFIASVDLIVERLLKAVQDPNGDGSTSDSIAANTLILFTSDNGGTHDGGDNLPLRGKKGMLNEGGVRVPLIAYWPGVVPANTITDRMVHSVDYYPTYLELAGNQWTPPQSEHPLDGESFAGFLLKPDTDRKREPIFYLFPGYMDSRAQPSAAVIDEFGGERFKLIYYYESDSWELYNLTEDIGETTNEFASRPELASTLSKKINTWLRQDHPTWKPKFPLEKASGSPAAPPPVL